MNKCSIKYIRNGLSVETTNKNNTLIRNLFIDKQTYIVTSGVHSDDRHTLPVKNRQHIEGYSQMSILGKSLEVCPLPAILLSHTSYQIIFFLPCRYNV